jgi:hypothetical protein
MAATRDPDSRRVMPHSIEVVDGPPNLMIKMPPTDEGTTIVETEGIPETIAFEIPWGPIIDAIISHFPKPGKKDGGGGCTTISITNPDGSSTTIKSCPPS